MGPSLSLRALLDVVIAKSTSFDDVTLRKLAAMAKRLKPGAIVVSFSHELPDASDAFDVLDCRRVATTFGTVTAHVAQRKRCVLVLMCGCGGCFPAKGYHDITSSCAVPT